MPSSIKIPTYKFEELSDRAKESARQWYRETALDYEWYDSTFENFGRICDILGVRLKTRAVRLYGGGTREDPRIFFSGFSYQGDGACFEANYAYAAGAHREIRAYAPCDTELHRIADSLRDVERRNFYQLRADVTHRGRYYHEYSMEIRVDRNDDRHDVAEPDEEAVIEAMRELARWLYRALDREYDYLTSDEAVDEAIIVNGYSFSEVGGRTIRLR